MVGLYSYSGQLHHILSKNIGIYHVAVCAEVVGDVQYSSTNEGGADLMSGRFLFYRNFHENKTRGTCAVDVLYQNLLLICMCGEFWLFL